MKPDFIWFRRNSLAQAVKARRSLFSLRPGVALLSFALALSGAVPAVAGQGQSSSLAGTWRFRLDPERQGVSGEWFKSSLPAQIELPGSCEQRGFGMKPDAPETRRLTHALKYVGPAWYQRDIVIPESWSGKRVELFLERCHWETSVWVDDRKIGMQNSLSAPHLHDLGRLSPGTHRLTVCVDNTYKIPIGTWAHALTEDTQGNWNGMIGRLELRATDPVWIRDVQVFPTKLKVSVGNQTGEQMEASIQSKRFPIPPDGAILELPISSTDELWDVFAPTIRQLTVMLHAGAFEDTKTVYYGHRDLSTKDKQFILNGRPVFLIGAVDECIYPLTGYPPMDKADWRRTLDICKAHGFNYMRFHSWCPPEGAFAAADELGFLFQIELPLWTMDAPHYGGDAVRDQFIRDELDRILDAYGNHPSFGLMAMGNESSGALESLVHSGRARDPRRLYRCENGDDAAHGDFYETGMRGILGPRTDWDRWTISAPGWIAGSDVTTTHPTGSPVPTLSHEVGQWEMYPNLAEEKKYTGALRAHYLDGYRKSLAANNMLIQAEDFAEASGKFSVQLYKEEIEASRRTWPFGGIQLLEARDYTGQGVAIVGWLDAFWHSKGLMTSAEFSSFCGPTVCLLRMPARVFTTADTFTARAEISHYGPKNLNATPEWSIRDDRGTLVAKGTLPPVELETGRVASIGEISVPLDGVAAPARLLVTLGAAGLSNRWRIWVYPAAQPPPPANVHIAHAFDAATRDALAAGARVVLLSSPTEGVIHPERAFYGPESVRALPPVRPGRNAIPGSFMPTFWNLQLFNQIGTLGILCDPRHPALAEFPTDRHSDWQWADLLGNFSAGTSFDTAGAPESVGANMRRAAGDVPNRSKAFILNETPADFRPIVQVIDNHERNAKLGSLFETRVGPGSLLVCGLDLDTDLPKRPAAQQLRRSLLNYAAGREFAPAHELPVGLLERLLTPAAPQSAPPEQDRL